MFSANGTFQHRIDIAGKAPLVVNQDGSYWKPVPATDGMNWNVALFDVAGNKQMQLQTSAGAAQFGWPGNMSMDADGNIWVADQYHGIISVFAPTANS